MALASGTRLGSYEILSAIGRGGMGEVYRALDPKLKRHVAIKVLPETYSRDAERIARFRREAQLLAALNHQNIAAIYGLEEAGDTMALVMEEVVEGGTLTGPLSIETALNYARQIADALEAAHEKGIIHRDLKPANIKVTPAGVVKVLDFGLATIVQPGDDANGQADPQNSPTLTRTLGTQAGQIMGTAAYMSPEQAAGKPVDKRSDIWSFGVVLFEMLTGTRLFEGGETISHTLADVLRAPIDFSKLPTSTPSAIRDLLRRCLDRDVKNRLRDIGEARVAIDNERTAPEPVATVGKVPPPRSLSMVVVPLLAAIIAAVTGFGWWRATRPIYQPLMRFADGVGADINTGSSNGPAVAISRDGERLAFISVTSDGKSHLSVRSVGSAKSTVLTGAEADGVSPVAPFFSPDGGQIGFFAGSRLKTISVEGGAAITLCDVGSESPRGASWGEDGYILFATQRTPLMRVSQLGGTAAPATELNKQEGEVTNRFGQLLPGAKALLFTASKDNNAWENATIQVQTIADRKRKTLVNGGYFGRYFAAPGRRGYLLYVHEGTVFAAAMDLNQMDIGPATPILEDVSGREQNGFPQLDVSSSGTLIYVAGSSRTDARSIASVDRSGNVLVLPAPPAQYEGIIRPSPDGTRIAVRVTEGSMTNLSVYELGTNRTTPLTFLKGSVGNNVTWTPDGKHLVFLVPSDLLSGPGVYWIRADGAGEPQRLLDQPYITSSFSPDGKILALFAVPGSSVAENGIWTVSLDLTDREHPKAGKPEVFLTSKSILAVPSFSPDGRWLAYVSSEMQPPQVFVRPFSTTGAAGGQWRISNGSANIGITWNRNANEVFYVGNDGRPYVVSHEVNGDSFIAKPPHLWSQARLDNAAPTAIMPDGKQSIIVLSSSDAASMRQTHVQFLINFADELQRRTVGK